MKTRMMKTGVAIMIFFMAGVIGFSQPPKGKMMNQKPGYAMQMKNMLNLTSDQETQLKNLRLNREKEMLPLQNRMKVLWAEYHELISAEKPNMKAVNANIDARTKLLNQMMKKNVDFRLKFRNILTEEQWLMIQSHKGKMGYGQQGRGMGLGAGMGMHHGYRGYGSPYHRMNPGSGRMNDFSK